MGPNSYSLSEIKRRQLSSRPAAARDKARANGVSPEDLLAALLEGPFASLVSRGLISEQDLLKVELASRHHKLDSASILMRDYGISRAELRGCLCEYFGLPFIEFDSEIHISKELISKLNPRYLKQAGWVPLPSDGDLISILIDNPLNAWKLQEVSSIFPHKQRRLIVGFREDIIRFIDSAFGTPQPTKDISTIMTELETVSPRSGVDEDEAEESITETDNVIIHLVNQIIIDADKQGASDIHIEPNSHDRDLLVRFRVDGLCHPYQRVPGSYRRPLAARIKILAGLDISERRKPQDGKIVLRCSGKKLELRVATIPTSGSGNEDVVMRLLASGEPVPIENLNLSERNLRELGALLDKPYGLILCVGPTGSGKTTTLHAALRHLNRPDVKIWTAEDPVEITQPGLRQVQVQNKIDLNFAALLRSFLRADPDVIMIGEMRDAETIEIALKASLTGHLVLSTLHTNSAPETVSRLLDMGVDPFSFGDALLGVIGQRLIRTLCKQCRQPYSATTQDVQEFLAAYGEEAFAGLKHPFGPGFQLHKARGCGHCQNTGYKGRTGIHELLVVSDDIRKLIHARAPISQIQKIAAAQGMTTLCQDGLLKSLAGQTDLRQVLGSVKVG
ncbi:MAG: GspE/PulE family protein [Elusimicrobiota bacterium]